MNVTVESGLQAGIAVDEHLHLVAVSSQDDHQPAAVILHSFQQGGNGLLAEVGLVASDERIGLVDEEHSTQRPVDNLVGLHSCLSLVFSHEPASVGFNQMTFL